MTVAGKLLQSKLLQREVGPHLPNLLVVPPSSAGTMPQHFGITCSITTLALPQIETHQKGITHTFWCSKLNHVHTHPPQMLETHQKGIHDALAGMEGEAERLYREERPLLDDDSR